MRREDKIKLEANTAKVYGRNEINKVVSKAVLMYLKGGFTLVPSCRKEDVNLVKGKEFVRIKTALDYTHDKIEINVLAGTNKKNKDLWDSELVPHANICTFYTVGNVFAGGITRSEAKAKECANKATKRYMNKGNWRNREVTNLTSDKAKEVAVDIIHKYPRTKSITTKNVLSVTKDNSGKWMIEYVTNNGNKKVITSHHRTRWDNKFDYVTFSVKYY